MLTKAGAVSSGALAVSDDVSMGFAHSQKAQCREGKIMMEPTLMILKKEGVTRPDKTLAG